MRLNVILFGKRVVASPYTLGPLPAAPLAHHLLESLDRKPEQTAVVDGISGEITSRKKLKEGILRTSSSFQNLLDPGSTVAVSLPNIPQYLLPVLGAIHAGSSVCLFNPVYTPEETKHAMQLTKPKAVVTTAISLPSILPSLPEGTKLILVGPGPPDSTAIPFSSMLTSPPADALSTPGSTPESLLDTVALMPFSSGTTGLPKAVCLSHRNVVSHLTQTRHPQFGSAGSGMNVLSLLPMFHMYGMTMTLTTLLKESWVTTLPRFTLDTFLHAIQEHKVNHLPIVPPIATVLAKHPDVEKYDLSSVSAIICAAAPLSKEIQSQLFARTKVDRFRNGYGMSEMVAAGIVPHPDTAKRTMAKGSIGQVMAGMEGRVVSLETGEDVNPGEEGEILLRGPNVMIGYLGNPGATAATIDSEGWIHTGDVGNYDEDGDWFITDRLKELIKVKGFQVAPAELEALLLSVPGVQDAGVIGIPDDDSGEVPRAFLVKAPGSTITEEGICKEVATRVASYKQLKGGVVFLEALPRSLAGKLLRKELRTL